MLKDADLKEVHMRFHPLASTPDGPAAPSVCNTTDLVYIEVSPVRTGSKLISTTPLLGTSHMGVLGLVYVINVACNDSAF